MLGLVSEVEGVCLIMGALVFFPWSALWMFPDNTLQ